ncbi:hypothetical protein [Bradyrhizobium sp. USDA 329]|uniref:hypothetical protein n=1 Tax=unclassified Bradyrhizobium TaxID=2631580 RepID=UPI0035122F3C
MEAVPGNSTTRPSDPSAVPVRRSVVSLADISLKVVTWSNNFRMMMARLAKPGCTFEHDQLDLMIIGIVMPHCLPEHRGGGIAWLRG